MCRPEVKFSSSSSNRVVPNELSPCHRLTNHWAWVVAVDFWWKVKSVSGAEYLAISIWILIELLVGGERGGRMDFVCSRRQPLMSPIRQWWSPFVLKWPAPAVTHPTIAWRRGTRTIRYPGNNSQDQAQGMDHRVPLFCFTPSAKKELVAPTVKQASTGTRLRLNLWPGDASKDDHVIYGHDDEHHHQRQHLLFCWLVGAGVFVQV